MKKIGIIIVSVLLTILLVFNTVKEIARSAKSQKVQSVQPEIKPKQETDIEQDVLQTEIISPTERPSEELQEYTVTSITPTIEPSTISESNSIVVEKEIERKEYTEVDINTIPYSNKFEEATAIISAKKVFFDGKQLLYLIELRMLDSLNNEELINYYVSYNSFNSFVLGDTVGVEYERFDNDIISINKIKIFSK